MRELRSIQRGRSRVPDSSRGVVVFPWVAYEMEMPIGLRDVESWPGVAKKPSRLLRLQYTQLSEAGLGSEFT
jgi:hypothetical protein